jgi:hypothetical protein
MFSATFFGYIVSIQITPFARYQQQPELPLGARAPPGQSRLR